MKYWKILGFVIASNNCISSYSQCFELFDFRQCKSGIESLLITPDEKYLVSGHLDGSISVWDMHTFSMLNTINYHTGEVNSILFNKEKNLIITSANDNKAVTWAIPSLYMLQIYDTPIEELNFAVIDSGSNFVYYGGYNRILSNDYNYDFDRIPSGAVCRIGYKSKINAFFYNDDTNQSIVTDGNISYEENNIYFTRYKNIYRYDMDQGSVDYVTLPHRLNRFTIGDDMLYIWGDGQLIKLKSFDPRKGYMEAPATFNLNVSSSSKIAVSKNRKLLATGDSYNEVIIWNEEDLTIKQVLFGHTQKAKTFEFYNDDKNLITGGYDGRLMIWKAKEDPMDCTDAYKDGIAYTSRGAPVKIFSKRIDMKECKIYTPDLHIQFRSEAKQDTISLYYNNVQIYHDIAPDWTSVSVKLDFKNYYNSLTYFTRSEVNEVKKLHVKIDDGVFPITMTLTTEIDETDAIRFIKN
jgi:WD40 repeat protein